MEIEKDEVLPFLDVLAKRTNNNKLAHGRIQEENSHRSLPKLHRAETICDNENRPEELKQIKEALTKNGFKEKDIDRVCRTQITRIEQQPTTYASLPYVAERKHCRKRILVYDFAQ
ncbi:hypothetical protein NQ318_019174 [Aromia moschata]|uniref:Helix-turn-helix domain-containing protein n=1 Tax=Aromia moschata TaxID=1265417 RepID=A0AAV8YQJ9_9CUCU|nr:hypothetical protein NQ318_019174 [Aromia moschata]